VSDAVLTFQQLWEDPSNRLWLAAAIGDWPTANELAQSHERPEVRRAVADKFEGYRQRRLAIARFNLSLEPDSVSDLEIFYQQGAKDFPAYAKQAIAAVGPRPDLAELLLKTGDPQWDQQLFDCFQFLSGVSSGWDPYEIFALAKALLERNYRGDDVLAVLAGYDRDLDCSARIFLKYAPARALPIIRRALRHGYFEPRSAAEIAEEGPPMNSSICRRTAVVLAVIDEPWSRREILDAVDELFTLNHDYSAVAALALALGESRDSAVREIGESWQAKCSGGANWSSEVFWFHRDMDALYEEAIVLRGVSVSAEPGPQPGDGGNPQADTQAD